MRLLSKSIGFVLAFALLTLGACEGPAQRLARYQREIDSATQAIAAAKDDARRAQAHSARGRAYAERARFGTTLKLIAPEEGGRLFDLATEDHDRALALAPGDARLHLDRGLTLYNRAALQDAADPRTRALFDAAVEDFSAVLEKDGGNQQALDMRGLIHVQCGAFDLAIADFTRVMSLDPKLGRLRLAETHCDRAASHLKRNESDLAIADYEKTIEFGIPADSCECQPDSSLARLYLENGHPDKAWEVVERARQAKRWIEPELIEQLERASGRAAR